MKTCVQLNKLLNYCKYFFFIMDCVKRRTLAFGLATRQRYFSSIQKDKERKFKLNQNLKKKEKIKIISILL